MSKLSDVTIQPHNYAELIHLLDESYHLYYWRSELQRLYVAAESVIELDRNDAQELWVLLETLTQQLNEAFKTMSEQDNEICELYEEVRRLEEWDW